MERIKGSTTETMRKMFELLRQATKVQRSLRLKVIRLFANVNKKLLQAAFQKWSVGYFEEGDGDNSGFLGNGSIALKQVRDDREDMQAELREVMTETASIRKTLQFAQYTRGQRLKLLNSEQLSSE